jgi:hypothetical protein
MVGDKVIFWAWLICGALGIFLSLIWIYSPTDLLFYDVNRNWFQNIIPFSVVLMISSWVLSVDLAIKGFRAEDTKKIPRWIIGSMGWCCISFFLFAYLTIYLISTSTPKIH